MTFSITVPNAGQSPGFFPAQNNTNFSRLKDIINNEHNFLDTASTAPEIAAQGIHKQVTLINKSATVAALPAGNGILYSMNDAALSTSQLFWYNGSNTTQITPGVMLVSGRTSVPVANNAFLTIFPNPGFRYQAVVFAAKLDAAFATELTYGVNCVHFQAGNNYVVGGSGAFVQVSYTGNDIQLKNVIGSAVNLCWTIQVNRIF